MDKKKLRLNLPHTAQEFIAGAKDSTLSKKEQLLQCERFPWEESRVRDDVYILSNLRLPEPLFLKLKFLAEYYDTTMAKLCRNVMVPFIEQEIAIIEKLKK